MMLISGRLICVSAAYSVVDLPEPVGPVTRIAPVGLRDERGERRSRISSERPSASSVGACFDLSSRRMTTVSPATVGSVATRMSSSRPGGGGAERDAAVLRLAPLGDVELREHLQAGRHARREPLRDPLHLLQHAVDRGTGRRAPSSCASKWTSLAPSSAACRMIELTIRTSGASETPSSSSRSAVAPRRRPRARRATDCVSMTAFGDATMRSSSIDDRPRGCDPERELVARRQPQLVDRVDVLRVGDRDVERVAVEPVRQRDRARSTCSGMSTLAVCRDTPDQLAGRRAAAGGGPRASARRPRSRRAPRRRAPRENDDPGRAGRARAPGRSGGTSPVASIRSATSSASCVSIPTSGGCGAGAERSLGRPRPAAAG